MCISGSCSHVAAVGSRDRCDGQLGGPTWASAPKQSWKKVFGQLQVVAKESAGALRHRGMHQSMEGHIWSNLGSILWRSAFNPKANRCSKRPEISGPAEQVMGGPLETNKTEMCGGRHQRVRSSAFGATLSGPQGARSFSTSSQDLWPHYNLHLPWHQEREHRCHFSDGLLDAGATGTHREERLSAWHRHLHGSPWMCSAVKGLLWLWPETWCKLSCLSFLNSLKTDQKTSKTSRNILIDIVNYVET